MDLFTPIVEEKRWHSNFSKVINEPESYSRDVINEWHEGFIDRDNKFIFEFQTTFNSSFWELYLFACLKKMRCSVDFSTSSPDFFIGGPEIEFCIEASTTNAAIDSTPEWERDVSPERLQKIDLNEIADFATIRLANTLVSKFEKYQKSYKDLDVVKNRPFVLAIAPFEQPFFFMQNQQAIRRVLYGYDIPIFQDFPEENRRVIYGHQFVDHIQKPNGSNIPVGYFANDQMKEISAVVYSNTATFGKVRALSNDPDCIFFVQRYNENGFQPNYQVLRKTDYHETVLDGLNIFHNPYAMCKLPFNLFDLPGVTQHWLDNQGLPENDCADGTLLQRNTIKLNYVGS